MSRPNIIVQNKDRTPFSNPVKTNSDSLVVRLRAPNMRGAVHQPCNIQSEGVPEDGRVPSRPVILVPEENRHDRWHYEAQERHDHQVCPEKIKTLSSEMIKFSPSNHFIFYLFCHMTTQSFVMSLMSTVAPLILTSRCFLTMSHPMCEKKNPLLALCGSALVSVNLWCTLWSLTHS